MALGSKVLITKLATLTRATAAATGVALAAVLLTGLASTDALVERSFQAALEQEAPATTRGVTQIAGSEDFWLSQTAQAAGAPAPANVALWTAPVKIGATMEIALGGTSKVFEVVDITEVPGVTRVDTSSKAASRLTVVSCREAGKSDGALLRLVVEPGDTVSGQPVAHHQRSL